jgi:hypothetical protein
MAKFLLFAQEPYVWLSVAACIFVVLTICACRKWRTTRSSNPKFDIEIAVLGTTGAGKTCFLAALVDRIVSSHALPENVCAYYLSHSQERSLRKLPDFSRTNQLTCLKKINASQSLLDELNNRRLYLIREQFSPFLTAQAVVHPAGPGRWEISDINSQYVMRQEDVAKSLLDAGSQDGTLVPCLCLYPVYYDANARNTEQIVKTELGRVKNRQSQGNIAPEDFYVALRLGGKECKMRFADFPGGDFQNQDHFDVNGVKRALATARAVFLVLDTTTLLSPDGRLLAGQQFMDNYALILREIWESARVRQEIVPVWLVLSKGDLYVQSGSVNEQQLNELTQQLQRMATTPLQGFMDMVSILPTIADQYTEDVRQLYQKIHPTFHKIFAVLQNNYLAVMERNKQKVTTWLLTWILCMLAAVLLFFEARFAYLFSRIQVPPPVSLQEKPPERGDMPKSLSQLVTLLSEQTERLVDLWKSPYAVSYYFCYRSQIKTKAHLLQAALAQVVRLEQDVCLGYDIEAWRQLADKEQRKFGKDHCQEIDILLQCASRLEPLNPPLALDLLPWQRAQAWNKEQRWQYRVRLYCDDELRPYPVAWRSHLQEVVVSDMEHVDAEASSDLTLFLKKYREAEDIYVWQQDTTCKIFFSSFAHEVQERIRNGFAQEAQKRWQLMRTTWEKAAIPNKTEELQKIYRFWPRFPESPDTVCPDMYDMTWGMIAECRKDKTLNDAADTLLGLLYHRCQVANIERSLARHLKKMLEADKEEGEKLYESTCHYLAKWLPYLKPEKDKERWDNRLASLKKLAHAKRITLIFASYYVSHDAFKGQYWGDWVPYIKLNSGGKETVWEGKRLDYELDWKLWTNIQIQVLDKDYQIDKLLFSENVSVQRAFLQEKIAGKDKYEISVALDKKSIGDETIPQWLLDIYREE